MPWIEHSIALPGGHPFEFWRQRLLGKGAATLNFIQNRSNTKINLDQAAFRVIVAGTFPQVQEASAIIGIVLASPQDPLDADTLAERLACSRGRHGPRGSRYQDRGGHHQHAPAQQLQAAGSLQGSSEGSQLTDHATECARSSQPAGASEELYDAWDAAEDMITHRPDANHETTSGSDVQKRRRSRSPDAGNRSPKRPTGASQEIATEARQDTEVNTTAQSAGVRPAPPDQAEHSTAQGQPDAPERSVAPAVEGPAAT